MAIKIKPKAKLISVGQAKANNAGAGSKAKAVKGQTGKNRKGAQKDGTYILYSDRGPKSK